VLYTRDSGAVTFEFRKGRWQVRTMSGHKMKSAALSAGIAREAQNDTYKAIEALTE